MGNKAYLGLGTNVGDREQYLQKAIQKLSKSPLIKLTKRSSIYETEPVGYLDQGRFLNMVLEIDTSLSPQELLDFCMRTEVELGRKREVRWGPRTIDLDILLYNRDNIETEDLIIPHPRLLERAFVMIPLVELDEQITHPNMEEALSHQLNTISGKEGIRIWKRNCGDEGLEPSES